MKAPYAILPEQTYYGGKGSAGTYQKIINQITPHRTFVSGYLGHCAITRYKKPAERTIGFDKSQKIINAWANTKISFEASFVLDSFINLFEYHRPDNETFLYLDPPYPFDSRKCKRPVYDFEMSLQDHIHLLQFIKTFKCNIAISTRKNALYEQELASWRLITFTVKDRRGIATEYLYMNYPEPSQLHDYSYLGNDFREREEVKRKARSLQSKISKLNPLERAMLFDALKDQYAECF